jgi:mono/diheme cytochrome c family protein
VPSCAVASRARIRTMANAAIVVSMSVTLILAAAAAISKDGYAIGSYHTHAQAQTGQTVFRTQCAICRGDALQRKAGSAQAGVQMLANAPGNPSEALYLDTLAHILKVTGYWSGVQRLTATTSGWCRS